MVVGGGGSMPVGLSKRGGAQHIENIFKPHPRQALEADS